MDTHIFFLEPPHPPLLQITYNKIHIVQFICTISFPQENYPSHNSTPLPRFWICTHHWKLPGYKQILIFHVDIPHKSIKLTTVIVILIFNLFTLLLPTVKNPDMFLPLWVWFCIFQNLFLYHIIWYLHHKTQKIKYRLIHTSFKNSISFTNRVLIDVWQFTLSSFVEVGYSLIYLLVKFLL